MAPKSGSAPAPQPHPAAIAAAQLPELPAVGNQTACERAALRADAKTRTFARFASVRAHQPARRAPEEIGVLPPVLAALLAATGGEARETAWATLVATYTPLLLHTAYRFGHSYDGAMDRYAYFLEHLHCNDFRRLRAFAAIGPGRFSTWLVVVARRLCLDYHRQRYGRVRGTTPEEGRETTASSAMRRHLAEMAGDEMSLSAIQDCSTPDPEVTTAAAECREALHAAVSSLEPRDKLLLTLRFDKELAAHEIAEIMGFATQFHVYRRLRAVLAALARQVPREYVGAIP